MAIDSKKKGLAIIPLNTNSKYKLTAADLKDPVNKDLQELLVKLSFIKQDLEEKDQQLAEGAISIFQVIQRNRVNK